MPNPTESQEQPAASGISLPGSIPLPQLLATLVLALCSAGAGSVMGGGLRTGPALVTAEQLEGLANKIEAKLTEAAAKQAELTLEVRGFGGRYEDQGRRIGGLEAAVTDLRRQLEERTSDRFSRSDFERWLSGDSTREDRQNERIRAVEQRDRTPATPR